MQELLIAEAEILLFASGSFRKARCSCRLNAKALGRPASIRDGSFIYSDQQLSVPDRAEAAMEPGLIQRSAE